MHLILDPLSGMLGKLKKEPNLSQKNLAQCILVLIIVGSVLAGWIFWGNNALEINEYEIQSNGIPETFSDFRIAHVSDLHNAEFGKGNETLIRMLAQTDPDIIVITGDLIDSRNTNVEVALDFAGQAVEIAPVYYVSGNHESRVTEYMDLRTGLVSAGVIVLENQKVKITREKEHITLIGIDDPSFQARYLFGDAAGVAEQAIGDLQEASDGYTILLSHRPELFDVYVDTGMDLVFSGHAHGGQFRLPLIGGLVAPNQGFFPKYDAGQFTEENTTMIVSKGVGNSIIPLRFNNRPEIIVVTLNNTK